MAQGRCATVFFVGTHTWQLRLMVRTLGKAVGHQQIKHIADIEALA